MTFQPYARGAYGHGDPDAERPKRCVGTSKRQDSPSTSCIDESREVVRAYGVWHRLGLDAWNIAHPAVFLIEQDRSIRYSFIGDSPDRVPRSTEDPDRHRLTRASPDAGPRRSHQACGSTRNTRTQIPIGAADRRVNIRAHPNQVIGRLHIGVRPQVSCIIAASTDQFGRRPHEAAAVPRARGRRPSAHAA